MLKKYWAGYDWNLISLFTNQPIRCLVWVLIHLLTWCIHTWVIVPPPLWYRDLCFVSTKLTFCEEVFVSVGFTATEAVVLSVMFSFHLKFRFCDVLVFCQQQQFFLEIRVRCYFSKYSKIEQLAYVIVFLLCNWLFWSRSRFPLTILDNGPLVWLELSVVPVVRTDSCLPTVK